jgi:hypothetical protein
VKEARKRNLSVFFQRENRNAMHWSRWSSCPTDLYKSRWGPKPRGNVLAHGQAGMNRYDGILMFAVNWMVFVPEIDLRSLL